MNLKWECVVDSPSRVHIPEVTVLCAGAQYEAWCAAYDPWIKSDRNDYSVWGQYATLASTGRFILPYKNQKPSRRFAEIHTAFLLESEGWNCWGGVLFFDEKRRTPKGKGNSKLNTHQVSSKWRWRWPSDIREWLGQPRNPDIAAYASRQEQWRFCEVKLGNESVKPEQLQALALLHLLTHAPVAVVRVVEETGRSNAPKLLPAQIEYKKHAKLDWISCGLR